MERYRRRKGNLFQGGDTKDLEDLLKQQITKEIQNLKDDYVLNVSENQFINYLVEKYRIECPVVQFDQCVVEPQKVLVSSNLLPYSFKFNIVITMSGAGKRFKDAGYDLPKPLIQIKSKLILNSNYELLCMSAVTYCFI